MADQKNEVGNLTSNIKQCHACDSGNARDEQETNTPGRLCKPYPFCRYHDTHRYMESSILDIIESGASDLIEPCHEYKGFNNTPDEFKMIKFVYEVIRFAAACMNCRTNGTIHFGIGDTPNFTHGQILGVVVKDKEAAYEQTLRDAINKHFEYKEIAQICIRPVRFVEILNRNMTSSDKYVIEVDIVPDSTICEEKIFYTFNNTKQKKATESKQFYVRDGGSSRDLLKPTTSAKPMEEHNKFVDSMKQRSQLRKQAEEKHLAVTKENYQGVTLKEMITGGSPSLDKSHFERYVIVTNKAHSSQFESLGFLVELNPTAVLDFDPETAKDGLECHFEQQSPVSVHLPAQYKITGPIEDIANNLKLTLNTSWVCCNGGIENEAPSDIDQWLMNKGTSVQNVISFLCRKDVLPNKRFLVIFLLCSTVSEKIDPLVETFSTFCQELGGTDQILCICDNKNAFTSWKDLIEARCGIDISGRCIFELSFAEVNGTILSLSSKNRRSIRFLPCGQGSRVLLEKKVELSLNTLEVLCVNQCEGGNKDKIVIEENFYRGGKVSWWNFYFSEQAERILIKRNKIDFIENKVKQILCSQTNACVLLNLLHVPGCGGTTLAMHTLWALKDRFRCAILKDNNADLAEVADQVVKLLTYVYKEQLPRVPVMLMIDDFDDMEKVFALQQLIENKCKKKNIQSKSPQVFLLNCMRSESPELTGTTKDTVQIILKNELSDEEQKRFSLKETVETFYAFMLTKKNLKPEYIENVVHNTLRSFNINQKHSQLLAVLTLLNAYCEDASLPVSLCQEFLSLHPKPILGTGSVQERFEEFSNLICCTTVKGEVGKRAVKMIHPNFAKRCLQELETTHKITKADITNLLLTTEEFYENKDGRGKLWQDVYYILMGRHLVKEASPIHLCIQPLIEVFKFQYLKSALAKLKPTKTSHLIQDIESETPELVENVLLNALERFPNDANIAQLRDSYLSQSRRIST
ncbi:sterile alpha motif domain-containing protein 9-like [Seriola lalandi dorsalis]|uniref:Sterile alpha motif domain-containing protein 9-like n=1 Tax=Seriola lalandi dorsalis TaxID=1841481 RepID=A0A3B4WMS3_SERLL|nr:sterile alpha motif domain-containing protein 9-like [Seriola lalandi dorsalis]